MTVRRLSRCAVVVDTRNVLGHTRSTLGYGARPTVSGISTALAPYGLDVVEVYAGVATASPASSPSARVSAALESNQRYAKSLVADGAEVLDGILVERQGKIAEKKVDVLLALTVAAVVERIARGRSGLDSVALMSEDRDLAPACSYGLERGVPTYAVATDTIHERPEQQEWMILDEVALATLSGIDTGQSGLAARERIARLAVGDGPPKATNWKSLRDQPAGRIRLVNNRGVAGYWDSPEQVNRGDRFSLYAAGLVMEPEVMRFPVVLLSESCPSQSFAGVDVARVSHWLGPTRVNVRLPSGRSASLSVSPGSVLPGQEVAVLTCNKSAERPATYFVGPVAPWCAPSTWPRSSKTAVAKITGISHAFPGWLEADLCDSPFSQVLVHKKYLDHVGSGAALIVALAGVHASGRVMAMPLTCCLP